MPANAAVDPDAGLLATSATRRGAGMPLARGLSVAQDPASAETRVMPEAAIRRMASDLILPPAEIRFLLRRLAGHR